MIDNFAEIKKRAMRLGEFTHAACILELDANGNVNIAYVGNLAQVSAMHINLYAMLIKSTMDNLKPDVVKR